MKQSQHCIFLLFLCLTLFSSCNEEALLELKNRNLELETQLDDCLNGEARVVARIEQAYSEGNTEGAKQLIADLRNRFPESGQNVTMAQLLVDILASEAKADSVRQAEQARQERLANLNNTGIWRVGFYVDEFGSETSTGYIRNRTPIRGTFSNTATQDSKLDVVFLITDANDISIQLYEYAGNNPVKAYSSQGYRILVEDAEKVRLTLTGWNRSDRITLDKPQSNKLHSSLLKGGNLKFRIVEMSNNTTQYAFDISNATYYDNAYRLLTEK